jgi:hypothetical protein
MKCILGLIGEAYAGKDSVAHHIVKKYPNPTSTVLHLADPLKWIVEKLFDFSHVQLWGSEKNIVDERYGRSPRDILQLVGTECFRSLYPNVWIDHLLRECNKLDHKLIMIPDVRFINEAEGIKKHDGVLWRIVCPNHPKNQAMTPAQHAHASEAEQKRIPEEWISVTLTANYGELSKLYQQVDESLVSLGFEGA